MQNARIVTANALSHGGVVFLTPEGHWSGRIGNAAIARDDPQNDLLIEIATNAGNRTRVVEPYAIEVTLKDGSPEPVRLRERIRAAGPTVRVDLAKLDLHVAGASGAEE